MRPEQLSDATPQLNVLQRLGGAIGVAVLAVVLQRGELHAHSLGQLAGAFDSAYWWSLGIAVLSLIPCLVLLLAETPPSKLRRGAAEGRSRLQRRGGRRAVGRVAETR